jgi:hypothetical protein
LPGLCIVSAAVTAGLVLTAMAGSGPASMAGSGPARRTPVGWRVPARVASPATPGLALLSRAALACRTVEFSGVEVVRWQGTGGPASAVVQVWHGGPGEVPEAAVELPGFPTGTHRTVLPEDDPDPQALAVAGLLGMSQRLAFLLSTNYRLGMGGWSQVAGRQARLVVIRRPGGSLAARLWLDRATGLPLRRQVFTGDGRLISDATFVTVRLGRAALTGMPVAAAQPWHDRLAPAALARLRARGWALPGPLPGHLALVAAREAKTRTGPVLDLDYSDGLWLVSVFVQRGHLPSRLAGWRRAILRGYQVYADDYGSHSIAWSARGFVYTVIATAPPRTVAAVVAALPHGPRPGLFARIGRGLQRLVSWLRL